MKILKEYCRVYFRQQNRIKTAFCFLVVCLLAVSCQPESNTQTNARIKFNNSRHNFGVVHLNKQVSHGFDFFNPGSSQLIIQDIKTSCGCTVADWPTKPLSEGENGQIHVSFDAALPGKFQKSVRVYYNGNDSPDTLFVSGKVKSKNN